MKWFFAYASGCDYKSHIASEALYEKVEKSLYSRGCSPLIKEETTSTILEMPGMIMADRHIHEIQLDGLTIRVPATDLETILERLTSLKERSEIGVSYYKLHAFRSKCVCFTPKQHAELCKKLEMVLTAANAIADAENEFFNEKFGPGKNKYIVAKPRKVRNKKVKA